GKEFRAGRLTGFRIMKSKEYRQFIESLEAKFPVDEWTFEGHHLWPFIRLQLCEDLFERPINNLNSVPTESFGKLKKIKKVLHFLTTKLKPLPRKPHDIVLLSLSQYR